MGTPSGLYYFIADTSILVVIAYLLARGRTLTLLFRENLTPGEVFLLGLVMGLVGLVEAIFPDVGLPYATHTLFVIFATIIGGLRVGLVTAAVVTLGAYFFQVHALVFPTMLAVLISAFLGKLVRRAHTIPSRLIGGMIVGTLAQACRLLLRMFLTVEWPVHATPVTVWITAPANGFGIALLLLVISDAQARAESERAQALVSQAQLTALRARIHPHFLFNTLNSIAELCGLAPARAEIAILSLSRLMHHALETGAATSMGLGEEIDVAQAYLAIEQERLGSRMVVTWQRDTACDRILVPPFAIQTLVENAIHHGVERKKGPVTIQVTIRAGSGHTLVAVRDDGLGMAKATRQKALKEENSAIHGLLILNQHLVLLYGRRARLRLFSQEGVGTLAAFVLPRGARSDSQRGGHPCSPP